MKRVVVLGAGRVGGLIARDLAADAGLRVRVADRDEEALAALADSGAEAAPSDLSDPAALAALLADADAAVGAVPGALGHRVLDAAIVSRTPLADISFSPGDPFAWDARAREAGVPLVVDCGVAPGLSNLFVGRSTATMERTDSVVILVGGLPLRRVWPYEYRSVFSPTDVVEEYTRPCRMRVEGREVVVPALTDVEPVDTRQAGTLEAFNTDGLRTLLHTIDAPTLKEKTLRYPGHAERMRMLRESGFFDETPQRFAGGEVAPRELTERLLFRAWELPPGEREFTLLRVQVEGRREGAAAVDRWELYDETCPRSGATSMARTTGFPCAIALRMLLDEAWSEPGVHPPEHLGRDAALLRRMCDELAARGVRVHGPQAG